MSLSKDINMIKPKVNSMSAQSSQQTDSIFDGLESEESGEYRNTTIAACVEPSLAETVDRFSRSPATHHDSKSELIRAATREYLGLEGAGN